MDSCLGICWVSMALTSRTFSGAARKSFPDMVNQMALSFSCVTTLMGPIHMPGLGTDFPSHEPLTCSKSLPSWAGSSQHGHDELMPDYRHARMLDEQFLSAPIAS